MESGNYLEHAVNRCIVELVNHGYPIQSEKWQGIEVGSKPEYLMRDVYNIKADFIMGQASELDQSNLPDYWARHIKPNLPWADDHFLERVGGVPLNPGEQYKNWPFYRRDSEMRNVDEKFTHSYMERYWPKYANTYMPPHALTFIRPAGHPGHMGIRYHYGDLQDVINLLQKQPNTRQAYLPVWFPEDTGANHGGRVPCTLGYFFRQRFGYLHVMYFIRSCDALRHFRDDIYLTMRLALWVKDQLAIRDPYWNTVQLGYLNMVIGSFHCFEGDIRILKDQIGQ